MLKPLFATQTTQNTFHELAIHATRRHQTTGNNATTSVWKKIAAIGTGILIGPFVTSKPVFAKGHDDSAKIKHAIQEILEHAIWHKVGHHILHLSSYASGLLGGLLSFQSLGETESFTIPRSISKPIVTQSINPTTGKIEDCLTLANGRKLMGQEILRFCQDLQAVQILESLQKGKKS